jgi:hypothetical protein
MEIEWSNTKKALCRGRLRDSRCRAVAKPPQQHSIPDASCTEVAATAQVLTGWRLVAAPVQGYGTAYFTSGHKYTGEFFDGKMQGNGTYTWLDGIRYTCMNAQTLPAAPPATPTPPPVW